MERILNDEDKLRRAEEIYYRRNNRTLNYENKDKKSKNSFWLNIIIMFNLAIIVFCIQNKDFIFTKEFLGEINKCNTEVSEKVINFFKGFWENSSLDEELDVNNLNSEDLLNTEDNSNIENAQDTVNVENVVDNNAEINTEENKIGSLSSTLDEMEEDIKNLKIAYSFINPINRGGKLWVRSERI